MVRKKVPKDSQTKVLNSLRAAATDINSLFKSTGSATTNGEETRAADICLKRDDPSNQNICATFQDLTVFKASIESDSPQAVINSLRIMRSQAVPRLKDWINNTNLKSYVTNNPNFRFSFANEPLQLTLEQVHSEIRARLKKYAQINALKHMNDDILVDLRACESSDEIGLCSVIPELAEFLRTQMDGTGHEDFSDRQIATIVENLPSAHNSAFAAADRAFTTFHPFVDGTGGVPILKLTTRIHSNYRFVTVNEPTVDQPDPKDSVEKGRAFLQFNANNLTGDESGGGVHFIKWSNTPSSSLLGRFLHLAFPREMTNEIRDRPRTSPVAHIGFMQSGDSGSIAVVEHIPFFSITSVDGKATSGGAGIRPLPEPIDDPDFNDPELNDTPQSSGVKCIAR